MHKTNLFFTADGLEEIYEAAHAKIRENPNLKAPAPAKDAAHWKVDSNKYRARKLTREQRRERVHKKILELSA